LTAVGLRELERIVVPRLPIEIKQQLRAEEKLATEGSRNRHGNGNGTSARLPRMGWSDAYGRPDDEEILRLFLSADGFSRIQREGAEGSSDSGSGSMSIGQRSSSSSFFRPSMANFESRLRTFIHWPHPFGSNQRTRDMAKILGMPDAASASTAPSPSASAVTSASSPASSSSSSSCVRWTPTPLTLALEGFFQRESAIAQISASIASSGGSGSGSVGRAFDSVECAGCGMALTDWESVDEPEVEHARHATKDSSGHYHCPLLRFRQQTEVKPSSMAIQMGIIGLDDTLTSKRKSIGESKQQRKIPSPFDLPVPAEDIQHIVFGPLRDEDDEWELSPAILNTANVTKSSHMSHSSLSASGGSSIGAPQPVPSIPLSAFDRVRLRLQRRKRSLQRLGEAALETDDDGHDADDDADDDGSSQDLPSTSTSTSTSASSSDWDDASDASGAYSYSHSYSSLLDESGLPLFDGGKSRKRKQKRKKENEQEKHKKRKHHHASQQPTSSTLTPPMTGAISNAGNADADTDADAQQLKLSMARAFASSLFMHEAVTAMLLDVDDFDKLRQPSQSAIASHI